MIIRGFNDSNDCLFESWIEEILVEKDEGKYMIELKDNNNEVSLRLFMYEDEYNLLKKLGKNVIKVGDMNE